MPVNDFAIPRMEPGKQRPIQSMEEARDWERLFIGEIKAGRDPRRGPSRSLHVKTQIDNVVPFLDAYVERCVKPAGLRSINAICSRVGVLKQYLGHLPLSALEEPDDINRFKTDSDYAEDVELATSIACSKRCGRQSTGEWRKRHRCSGRARSIASACD